MLGHTRTAQGLRIQYVRLSQNEYSRLPCSFIALLGQVCWLYGLIGVDM